MGRVFRPWYYKKTPDGREKVYVKDWYAEWQVNGKTKRKKVGTKALAVAALAKFEDAEVRRKLGLPNPRAEAEANARLVSELVDEYLTLLTYRDRSPAYRATVKQHLADLAEAARWRVWSDVTADALMKFAANVWMPVSEGGRGLSRATANGYVRTAKSFAKWYANKLGTPSPLRGVLLFNEQVGARRTRRILTSDEFEQLLTATEAAPAPHNSKIGGRERAALYRVAAHTGLRASELASLTPKSFRLDRSPPVVTIEAAHAKGRRTEFVPLPPELADLLRPWLAEKNAGERVWPGNWAVQRRQVRWLERDAQRAGIEGRVTFHNLRRRFVTRLIRSGADVDQVRRLARHKNVATTLNYYAESSIDELAAVAVRAYAQDAKKPETLPDAA